MTDNEEAEFNDVLLIMIKRSVDWYRGQDFSHMNDDVRPALESIFSPGEGYDPSASYQIGINMMMFHCKHAFMTGYDVSRSPDENE
jgi:hypothetical protein